MDASTHVVVVAENKIMVRPVLPNDTDSVCIMLKPASMYGDMINLHARRSEFLATSILVCKVLLWLLLQHPYNIQVRLRVDGRKLACQTMDLLPDLVS